MRVKHFDRFTPRVDEVGNEALLARVPVGAGKPNQHRGAEVVAGVEEEAGQHYAQGALEVGFGGGVSVAERGGLQSAQGRTRAITAQKHKDRHDEHESDNTTPRKGVFDNRSNNKARVGEGI